MGLDMYLYRRENNQKEEEATEVAYWRKANAIHSWFIRNVGKVENCETLPVTKENLEQLVKDCKTVMNNHDLAESILPTQGGFFFGSTEYTEYNEWYFGDLADTVNMMTAVINETDWSKEEVGYLAWW